jgi:hypothetical protein
MTVTDRRQTRPVVREGAPQRHHSNFQPENNIWPQVPDWTWHQDILADRPSVVTWLWLWLWVIQMELVSCRESESESEWEAAEWLPSRAGVTSSGHTTCHFSRQRKGLILKHLTIWKETKKKWSCVPVGSETKDSRAGEGQEQFTGLVVHIFTKATAYVPSTCCL